MANLRVVMELLGRYSSLKRVSKLEYSAKEDQLHLMEWLEDLLAQKVRIYLFTQMEESKILDPRILLKYPRMLKS